MITLFRRGRVWYLRECLGGRERTRSLRTTDHGTALALRRKAELGSLAGIHEAPWWPEFADEFERWITPHVKPSTVRRYLFVVKRFGKFLGTRPVRVDEITPATLSGYTDARLRDKHPTRGTLVGPEGIKADLRILRRVFSYARACRYVDSSPVVARRLNSRSGLTKPFSQDEIAAMLRDRLVGRRPQLRAELLTFLHTGLRVSDVITLEKRHAAGGRLLLRTRKRGTDVSIAMHPALGRAIADSQRAENEAQRSSPLLFSTDSGRPVRNLATYFGRLFDRCGIKGGHVHRFRDTFAVRLLAHGASLYDVAKLLGISVGTAERHYSPYVRELQERSERLVATLDFDCTETARSKRPNAATFARKRRKSRARGSRRKRVEVLDLIGVR